MEVTTSLIRQLQKTFDKHAWHGPAVTEVLADVDQELALARLPGSHSIVELVNHMTAWRMHVISRMSGDLGYTVGEAENFPADTDWNAALHKLNKSQELLLKELSSFPESRLTELVPQASHKYTFNTMLHGIIHHDLYHIGQIVLIKKYARP